MMETSWHSYPSIYNLGHKALDDLFAEPVLVEEKVDGSQFSFGVFPDHGLRIKSKRKEMPIDAPESLFNHAAEVVRTLDLIPGWTYRAEYLSKPKHNALTYERIPANHLIVFDINTGHERYLPPEDKRAEAERLGLECVPVLFEGLVHDIDLIRELLASQSQLGAPFIEGVVIKNYARFGVDKKVLMGKYVSERFKEKHEGEWRASNPTKSDVMTKLVNELKSERRWEKAVERLRDDGALTDTPRDIGSLIKEVQADILKEEREHIMEVLFADAWKQLQRRCVGGLPEWYKDRLLDKQKV